MERTILKMTKITTRAQEKKRGWRILQHHIIFSYNSDSFTEQLTSYLCLKAECY